VERTAIARGPRFATEVRAIGNYDSREVRRAQWMRAYIGVVAHPYFAVTGADGSFELRNVPPGD